MKLFTFLLCILLSTGAVASDTPTPASALIDRATSLHLSSDPTWMKLVHYEQHLTGVESAIHSEDFFLAPDGKRNPASELQATLAALAQPVGQNPDDHAQCRFPARFLWLRQRLQISNAEIPPIRCPKFNAWTLNGSTESISIVFATGYLGNPASYYGHTLLKFNSKNQKQRTALLDTSVNYGAIVPDGEDPISYIFKGVFGGYSGGFSHIEYYFHTQNYSEIELRDMWEYRLDLPQRDVDLIVAHAWEVLGKKYTYYFFRKNCAYRMAEIVQVVPGLKIIPETPLFTIPQSLIKEVSEARFNDHPLVKTVIFHPSRQSTLNQDFRALSADQKQEMKRVIASPDAVNDPAFGDDYAVLDTLLDYYQFIRKPKQKDQDPANEAYRKVLAKRYLLPPHPRTLTTTRPESPDESRRPSYVSLGLSQSSERGHGYLLRVRPAYYDPLDADSTHVKNSALAMADLTLSIKDSHVKLKRLDLLNIESANTAVTGLPGDKHDAWMVKASIANQDLSCSDCLVPRLEGAWGKTQSLGNVDLTGYIGGGVRENWNDQGASFVTLSGRSVISLTPSLRVQLGVGFLKPAQDLSVTHHSYSFDVRYQFAKSHDLRFAYREDHGHEYRLSVGYYF